MRYLRMAALAVLTLLALGVMVASQINQAPRTRDQVTADQAKEQEKARADADQSKALITDSGTPIRSLGSLPNPPAPDQSDKATPATVRPQINPIVSNPIVSKTKSQ
jgi:hypothetical protein